MTGPTREHRLATALTEARAYLDEQLYVEIDNNTINPAGKTRDERRATVIIDESGGRQIPILEALIARIDAALVTDGGVG